MTRVNRFIFNITCLIVFGLGTNNVALAQDTKAQELLKQSATVYKAMKSIDAQFSYTLENPAAKVKDTQQGSLQLQGNKYKLNLMGHDVVGDGANAYTIMHEAKEVHVKTMADFSEETDLDPTTIFTVYEKGFKGKYVEEATLKGKKSHVIDLFPEDPGKKPFSRIRLWIDISTKQILSSKTFNKDGSTLTLDIKQQKANQAFPAETFKVDVVALKAKGMEIVDLR